MPVAWQLNLDTETSFSVFHLYLRQPIILEYTLSQLHGTLVIAPIFITILGHFLSILLISQYIPFFLSSDSLWAPQHPVDTNHARRIRKLKAAN